MYDNGFKSWSADRKDINEQLSEAGIHYPEQQANARQELLLFRVANALEGIRGELEQLNGTHNTMKEAAWRSIERLDAIIENTDEIAERSAG